jgi:hypothetical protein
MKKIVLALCLLMTSCMPVMAEVSLSDFLAKLPPMKQGVAYSFADKDFSYLSTIELASWKGFTLEAGYSSKDKIVGVISYPILKLKDLGVTLPILDLLECNIGLYAGYGRIENLKEMGEADFGISATLLRIKW